MDKIKELLVGFISKKLAIALAAMLAGHYALDVNTLQGYIVTAAGAIVSAVYLVIQGRIDHTKAMHAGLMAMQAQAQAQSKSGIPVATAPVDAPPAVTLETH